jgi:D-alanyl-D-alanine endopeptidase (penicillin-binding protein 7)
MKRESFFRSLFLWGACLLIALSGIETAFAKSERQKTKVSKTVSTKKTVKKVQTKKITPISSSKKRGSLKVEKQGKKIGKNLSEKQIKTLRKKQKGITIRKVVFRQTSQGHLAGLQNTYDPLGLKASSVLVTDLDSKEILFSKNPDAVLPIASITKLMLGVVVAEANLPLDEEITIGKQDTKLSSTASSRLKAGMVFSRSELLQMALMSSENRAAHALARTYPGGVLSAVRAMNHKAQVLNMHNTSYADPTGLSSQNLSTASDLTKLVQYASKNPTVSSYSVQPNNTFTVGKQLVSYHSTNRLVSSDEWEVEAQKTGFISAAGQCLLMQAKVGGRRVSIALLDSVGFQARMSDAERIRAWIQGQIPQLDSTSFVSAKSALDRSDYPLRGWDIETGKVYLQEMSSTDFARLSQGQPTEVEFDEVALDEGSEEFDGALTTTIGVINKKATHKALNKPKLTQPSTVVAEKDGLHLDQEIDRQAPNPSLIMRAKQPIDSSSEKNFSPIPLSPKNPLSNEKGRTGLEELQ